MQYQPIYSICLMVYIQLHSGAPYTNHYPKDVCFKPRKYAKVKLSIKFIKNSTLIGRFTFWQLKANFTTTINFT